MMKIAQLQAHSLRGIPASWPPVDLGDRGLTIYGPNGVGKSSLVDALEFALTGQSTLYSTARLGVNWSLGAPHVHGGEMRVAVVLRQDGREYTLTPGEPPAPEIEAWCALAARSGFVLRRHMLLNFVDAQPRHRYDRLEPLLNLTDFLAVESALQHAASRAQLGVTNTETKLRMQDQAVRTIFGLAPDAALDEATVVRSINDTLRVAGVAEIVSLGDCAAREAAIADELGDSRTDSRLAALHSLKGQAQRLGFGTDLKALMDQVEARASVLEGEVSGRDGPIITDFLIRGREIISEQHNSDCPLCEQPIDRDQTMARLSDRINADDRITVARQAWSQAASSVQTTARDLAADLRRFISEWGKVMTGPLPASYESTFRLLEEIAAAGDGSMSAAVGKDFAARLAATVASHQPSIDQIDAGIVTVGGGERRTRLLAAKAMLSGASKDWPEYLAQSQRAKAASRRLNVADRVHGHAVEARKATVQHLLDSVADVANGYYEILHPGEELASSKLIIRPTEDGSVNLSSVFYGREAPPLLYYSESHLDTLGLCYFLALRRREADEAPAFKVLVLDDVVHSVDARHRGRVVRLLKEHFGDHQLIVTTHDAIFYQLLRQTLGSNGFVYLALTGWDIERGPLRGDPSTDLDRVVDPKLREEKSVEELAGAGGRLLEWMLREATESLEVAIPARFKGKHTIGSMWPAFAKKLRGQKHFQAEHPNLAQDVEQTGWVRNEVGAHYNDPASPVDPAEVRAHASHLADLYGALTCKHCGTFVAKHGDQDWRCSCARTAYPPVPAPSSGAGGDPASPEAATT